MSYSVVASIGRRCQSINQKQGLARTFITNAAACKPLSSKPVFTNQIRHGTSLKVILLENILNRGMKGEIVKVKRGFARNLLIPRKMAAYMTDENEIKHKELIEYRVKAKESGITEDGPYISFNKVKVVELLQIEESDVIDFVKPVIPGTKGQIEGGITVEEVLNYLRDNGYEVPTALEIKIPAVPAIGLYPIVIRGTKCVLNVIELFEMKKPLRGATE